MKVFLSWSGDLSHKVALELREWLPYVIQSVQPYVSSEDIDKGSRWSIDIAKELEDSSFGVLCVTPHNLEAPWLNFEAGALSKAFSTSNVSPFLFGLKPSDLKKSPLLQFQSTLYDKKDLLKLVLSINNALGKEKLDEHKLKTTFDVWFENLKSKLDPLLNEAKVQKPSTAVEAEKPNNSEAMEEILELSREQYKLLRNPEAVLPPDYLLNLINSLNNEAVDTRVIRDLDFGLRRLKNSLNDFPVEMVNSNNELNLAVTRLERAIYYLLETNRRNRQRSIFE